MAIQGSIENARWQIYKIIEHTNHVPGAPTEFIYQFAASSKSFVSAVTIANAFVLMGDTIRIMSPPTPELDGAFDEQATQEYLNLIDIGL